jgi:pectin methylesterase-like acyl-CoA thioesterase
MATEEQILELRGLVSEPDDSSGWTDAKLAAAIDSTDSLNGAASKVWYLKAGEYASLVDVSESGSSRKLSDLRKNAMEMGAHYGAAGGTPAPAGSGPVIQRIRRGFS